jgi:hypothetical protein
VEFYHNGKKIASNKFKVNKPRLSIIEANLCSEVDSEGRPINLKQKFYSTEDICLSVNLDCLIEGNNIKSEWFTVDNRIEETYINIDEDYFYPSYKVFKLENKNLPLGHYSTNLYLNDSFYDSYKFEIAIDKTNLKFYEEKNREFCFKHPYFLKVSEEKFEDGINISLISDRSDDYQLNLWIFAGNYSFEDSWEEFFSNIILNNLIDEHGLEFSSREKFEKNGCSGYSYKFKNMQDNWNLDICYKENEKNKIIFASFSIDNFRPEAEEVFNIDINSYNFYQN